MTTATSSKPATAPVQQPAKVIFQGNVAIEKIDVFSNIRKTMNPAKLKELTENMRQRGVKQAVLLRPSAEAGRYFIVDGHRRLKAATEAGLKVVPAIVQDLTADEAAIDQAVTYLQREDLGPIEEAQGFKLLLKSKNEQGQPKYTVEMIAGLVGKGEAYVYRAVRLADLPANAIKMIESGELTPTHGHHLLRISEKDREKTLRDWTGGWQYREGRTTANHLAAYIEQTFGSDLTKAPFPKDKEYAGAAACTGCPSNSGNQGMLIPGAEKGMCTFRKCFDQKVAQHKVDTIAKIKAKYPDAIEINVQDQNHWIGLGTYANGWSVKGEIGGKGPKVPYKITINPDLKVYYWTKAKNVKKPTAGRSASSDEKPKSEHERFIEKAIETHVEAIVKKAKVAPTEKQMLAAINANYKGRWASSEMKKILPATAKNALRVFFQDLEDNGGIDDEEMAKALDVDLKKETVTATKAAEAEWMKLHPKSKA